MNKILFVCTTSKAALDFRIELIEYLKKRGFDISILCFDKDYSDDLKKVVTKFYSISYKNRSINPFNLVKAKKNIKKIIIEGKFDLVFSFQTKPSIFTTKFCSKNHIPNLVMLEGLGDPFCRTGFKWITIRKILSIMMKSNLKFANEIFVLNKEDKNYLLTKKIINNQRSKISVIDGIGIDSKRYKFSKLPNKYIFLYAGRMIKTKGIIDFCEAAKIIKQNDSAIIFKIIGAEGDIRTSDIKKYIDDGIVIYEGLKKNIINDLEECTCLVLPTYYNEGMPRSILEAMSIGRPIITTNTRGCNVEVIDNYNGYIVEPRNPVSIANAITKLCNNTELNKMGENSRKMILEKFDSDIINLKLFQSISLHILNKN